MNSFDLELTRSDRWLLVGLWTVWGIIGIVLIEGFYGKLAALIITLVALSITGPEPIEETEQEVEA